MNKLVPVLIAFVLAPAVASAHVVDVQHIWDREIHKRCPERHLEWMSDGDYYEADNSYDANLSANLRRKVNRIADYRHRCSGESIGLYCEWVATIDAYQKLNRLADFATWACRHVKCQEAADCKIHS